MDQIEVHIIKAQSLERSAQKVIDIFGTISANVSQLYKKKYNVKWLKWNVIIIQSTLVVIKRSSLLSLPLLIHSLNTCPIADSFL